MIIGIIIGVVALIVGGLLWLRNRALRASD